MTDHPDQHSSPDSLTSFKANDNSVAKSLPPVVPVLIAAIIIGAIVFLVVRANKPVTPASGSITEVFHVEQSTHDRVLVGIVIHLKNNGEKPVWVREVEVSVTTPQGEFKDSPAPGSDIPRYYQAYPALKQSSAEVLGIDTKIPAENERDGLLIVGFPLNGETFDKRQSLQVRVSFYDQKELIIKQ